MHLRIILPLFRASCFRITNNRQELPNYQQARITKLPPSGKPTSILLFSDHSLTIFYSLHSLFHPLLQSLPLSPSILTPFFLTPLLPSLPYPHPTLQPPLPCSRQGSHVSQHFWLLQGVWKIIHDFSQLCLLIL